MRGSISGPESPRSAGSTVADRFSVTSLDTTGGSEGLSPAGDAESVRDRNMLLTPRVRPVSLSSERTRFRRLGFRSISCTRSLDSVSRSRRTNSASLEVSSAARLSSSVRIRSDFRSNSALLADRNSRFSCVKSARDAYVNHGSLAVQLVLDELKVSFLILRLFQHFAVPFIPQLFFFQHLPA